ncbi:MAG: CoB--CoM heterodisulfide reductase iron-sulfur subunit B family protein [Bacillota bacterium]
MRYSYFPGCTLHTQAKNFGASALASARELGIELVELPDWQCCGAVYPLASDNHMALVSPYRTLSSAHSRGEDLVTMCSGCYNVLKRTNVRVAKDPDVQGKLSAFVETDYRGDARVLHLLEVLKTDLGFEALKERVTRPLTGLSVAPYYGCLLLRPPEDMQFDDAESPSIFEDFIRALGATPVDYPYRTECCGAYVSISEDERSGEPARAILRSAGRYGAHCIVTSCPLCQYNLDVKGQMPVLYFTQLLALALGCTEVLQDFSLHHVDPRPVLAGFANGV